MAVVTRNVAWLANATTLNACAATDAATGTIYAYVSSSATPPSAANLKAGTGAEASASTAVAAVKRHFFSQMTVSSGTWYVHYLYNDGGSDSAIITEGPFATAGPSCVITETATTATARQYDLWLLEVFSESAWGLGPESKHRVTWSITGPDGWTWTETDRRTLSETAGEAINYASNWVGRAVSVPMTVAGTYTATATITDAAGNTSTSSEATITVAASSNIYTVGSGGDYTTLGAWATAKSGEDDQEVRLTDAATYDIGSNITVAAEGVRFVNTSGGVATIRNNGGDLRINNGGATHERVVFHDLYYSGVLGDGTETVVVFIASANHVGSGFVGGKIQNSIDSLLESTYGDSAWLTVMGMEPTSAQTANHHVGAFGGQSGGVMIVSGPLATSSGERPYRCTFACQVLNDVYADTEDDPGDTKSALRLFKCARADIVRGYTTNTVEIGLQDEAYGERIRSESHETRFSETGTDDARAAFATTGGADLGFAFVDLTVTAFIVVVIDPSITSPVVSIRNTCAASLMYNTGYKGAGSVTQTLVRDTGSDTLPTGFETRLVGNIWASADLSLTASSPFQYWLDTANMTGYEFQDNIWPDISYSRNNSPYRTVSGASDTPTQYDAQAYTTNESHQIVTLDGAVPSVLKAVTLQDGAHVDFNGTPRVPGDSGYAGALQYLAPVTITPSGAVGSDTVLLTLGEACSWTTGEGPSVSLIESDGTAAEGVAVGNPISVPASASGVTSFEAEMTSYTLKSGKNYYVTVNNSGGGMTADSSGAPVESITEELFTADGVVAHRSRERTRTR